MLERSLEIIVRRCPTEIFEEGWQLRAQQLSIPSGRIDLLFSDNSGTRHVVELKKGTASCHAIEQVLEYAKDLSRELDGTKIIPWVVAHGIPDKVANRAKEMGVSIKAIPLKMCAEIAERQGILDADLIGKRKDGSVISGGGSKRGLRNLVPNEKAYASMPINIADLLRKAEIRPHVDIASGGMQTVIHYRGVKIGGVNRKHRGGVAYISFGVVLTPEHEKRLSRLGFVAMTKTQNSSKHEHVWWEISWFQSSNFFHAVEDAMVLIDKALGV
jgi:hypothetical protein